MRAVGMASIIVNPADIIVNPADIPITTKESRSKNDQVNARKLVMHYSAELPHGADVPN